MEKDTLNAGRRVPKRLIGRPCPTCGWRFQNGQRYTTGDDGVERHVVCPPEEQVLPFDANPPKDIYGRIEDRHLNCTNCYWPYSAGEAVVYSPQGPLHHEVCHQREREARAAERIRCEACNWWIEAGETYLETLVADKYGRPSIERVHQDCPADAELRLRAEQEQAEADAAHEAEEKRAAKYAEMAELRERYTAGDIPSDYMMVHVSADFDWAKAVTGIDETRLNDGGYAYLGQFIKPGRTSRVAVGAVVLAKERADGRTFAVAYMADPTVLPVDGDDPNAVGLRLIAQHRGPSWATRLYQPVRDAIEAGRPEHLVPPPPPAGPEPAMEAGCEPAAGPEEPPSVEVAVYAAVELLEGLGYRVVPPNQLAMEDGPPEWDE